MIDIEKFSQLQKVSKESFFQQKSMVKQVMAGKTVLCVECQQPLKLTTPEGDGVPGIRCVKGCTELQLDFV